MQITFWRQPGNTKGTKPPPDSDFDRELAEGIGNGDRESLLRLLDRHGGPVYGYLQRRLGPGHEAVSAEVMHSTFEQALRRMKRYARGRASVPMRLWLLKLASDNLARKQGRVRAAKQVSAQPEDGQLALLRQAMERLTHRKQAVLSLALFEEMSAEEVAAAAGLSLSRAMSVLRAALRELNVEPALEADAEAEDTEDLDG